MLTEDLDKRISIHEMLNLDEIKVAITRCVEAGLTIMPEFKKIDLNL